MDNETVEKRAGVFYPVIGTVADNKDPEGRGRIRVRCPTLIPDAELPSWALPMGAAIGLKEGSISIPRKGAQVIVFFLEGKVELPMWMLGTFLEKGAPPALAQHYPETRVLHQSQRGPVVTEDRDGNIRVEQKQKRQLDYVNVGGRLVIDTAPVGSVKINRPDPEQRAARKGDATRSGSVTIAFSPGTGGASLSVTYTDENGNVAALSPTGGTFTIEGKITTGSDTVFIGDK